MKILIIRNSPNVVNLDSYNNQEMGLARALKTKGHEVGIVFYTDKDYKEEIRNDIYIYYVPSKKILNYGIFDNKIYDICDKYDVIQTSEYNQIMSFRLARKYPNKVVIYHGPYYRKKLTTIINNKVFDIFYLRKYRKINPSIMTKSVLAEEFLKSKGFKNVTTVGVGLDDSKFKDSKINNEFNTYYKEDNINMLSIATIEKRKNTLFLLQVLKKLVANNNKYFLFLIGKTNEKGYKDKCLSYIKENNLENNVVFIERVNQDELKDIYTKIDILLLPSNYEIFGMVLLEAIYFNKAILSSINGGSSFLLDDNNTVSRFDVKLWTDKIESIVNTSVEYDKKVLWNDIVDKFIDCYNKNE